MSTTTITVRSPYDGSEIGEVPAGTERDVDSAVTAARAATVDHRLPAWLRAEILTRASDLIGQRREELARTIAREAAKPISSARIEVARALSTIGFCGIEARKLGGEVLPTDGSMASEGKFAVTTQVPIGVVGAITPFNFPVNLVAHKVGPAIAAGCPVVLKPASQTPFSALAFAQILADAGLPDGWLNVVTGSGTQVGNAMVDHPQIEYVSFTGSSDVGWQIRGRAPRKRVGLELGNSTPVIIEPDGDWEQAARAIASAGYTHSGQSCISVQRVYVHRSLAEPFTRQLVDHVRELRVGDPLDESTDMSSLVSEGDRERVCSWIGEAIRQGAQLATGGEVVDSILTPTVLTNTTLDMRVCKDEVFGPVVCLQTYENFDDAIDLANGTRYGLQAGIYTRNMQNVWRASNELDFGGVIVNEIPSWRADIMPYGGVKDSGNTREGPAYAIKEMTEMRLTVINM